MICPFCRQSDIQDNSGKTVYSSCHTAFEIDARGECVFVDTDSPRMPTFGQACTECGLIQHDHRESCVYCGTSFNKTVH